MKRNERRNQRRGDEAEQTGLTTEKVKKIEREPEDINWKKLQGDVFRVPENPSLMAWACGTGAQSFVALYISVFLLMFGFMNPFLRIFIFYIGFLTLAVGSLVNGYISAVLMKYFGATDWCLVAIQSSVLFPSYIFSVIALVDVIEWFERSTALIPFTSIVGFTIVWAAISIPLGFYGAYTGFR